MKQALVLFREKRSMGDRWLRKRQILGKRWSLDIMTSTGTVDLPPRGGRRRVQRPRRRGRTPPPPEPPELPGDGEEGMLSMSFLDHVQELRSRILKMVLGLLIAGAISLTSVNQLWRSSPPPPSKP
jgi:hypothetical protein